MPLAERYKGAVEGWKRGGGSRPPRPFSRAVVPTKTYPERIKAWNRSTSASAYCVGGFFAWVSAAAGGAWLPAAALFALWLGFVFVVPVFYPMSPRARRYRRWWYLAAGASGAGIGYILWHHPVDGFFAFMIMCLALLVGQQIGHYEAHAEGAQPPPER